MVSAKTLDDGRLREAAKKNSDESILIHLADKDCVAIEVKYHKRCYERYTSFVRHETKSDDKYTCKYEISFNVFCETFVRKEIIENDNIYFMKKVKQEFVNVVKQVEDADASNYRTFRLKKRLQEKFPRLVFHIPKERNKSEIVFAESINTGNVAENYLNEEDETSQSESDAEDEGENEDHETFTCTNDAKKATLKDLYNAALTVRNTLRGCKASWYEHWPPLASEITGENVRKLVSPILFNFLTWLLGFSEEPEESTYVKVEENIAVKVFSVCQDLIYICSKGRIQTPKSLALAMAVRQISG